MSSVQSAVLGLLDESSIPGLFKGIIRDLLPNMSRIQQSSILASLYAEFSKKKVINIRRNSLYRKYKYIFDELEQNPDAFPLSVSQVLKSMKSKIGPKPASKVTSQLSSLKAQIR